jgi:hypothetical protein
MTTRREGRLGQRAETNGIVEGGLLLFGRHDVRVQECITFLRLSPLLLCGDTVIQTHHHTLVAEPNVTRLGIDWLVEIKEFGKFSDKARMTTVNAKGDERCVDCGCNMTSTWTWHMMYCCMATHG